jgi:hypothetical protein
MTSLELGLDDRKIIRNAMEHVAGSLAILGSTESFTRSIAMPSTKRLLELAIKGLEVERERIDEELLQLRQQLNGTKGPQHAQRAARKMAARRQKRKMSAAAKRQISKRMREIWVQRRKAA